ncbi:hypothetical protein CEP54_014013 [Fusarium duplospermum]|uniref:Uncharacterized protein n=1 Tax=Fusarium duplospermum TaxID=1325734 RepID=A0A428NZ61_9HYPO|nr:hypothetical protein CEP54_014013 [Fusarium duplospermum]
MGSSNSRTIYVFGLFWFTRSARPHLEETNMFRSLSREQTYQDNVDARWQENYSAVPSLDF